ncbi:class I adenylate-forming enzyme family protein [Prescottella sp. R16]|uniref:class I adenylate-forming enzyme family protein n=1 Tax=Prescottella sp. R16 TaxID=3064529 RepID=UPI00272E8646|nr:class I adenylate-forming enzyme family protein [Prescottella sp. R16]
MSELSPSSPSSVPCSRIVRRSDGLLHFTGLPSCLTELLDIAAHRYAAREAVVEVGGPRLTYAQLWTSAARIAGGLLEQGVSIGDRVAIRIPDSTRWVQAFLGVLLSGGVPVPVHPGRGPEQLRHIAADSGSILVLDAGTEFPTGTPFIDDGASPQDSALLFYTGGTTGRPRGVELSHENVLSTIEAVLAARENRGGDRHAVLLPLSSGSACVARMLPILASGGTVVLVPDPDPDGLLRVLAAERVDRVSVTAPLARRLAAASTDAAAVRVLELDDEPVSAATVIRLQQLFPGAEIVTGWGMTETGGAGMVFPIAPRPVPAELLHEGMEFAVTGTGDGSGAGELWCRGPSVMRGYWADPDGTARTTTGGWLHTGDVVRIGADGGLRMAGRAADAVEIPRGVVYGREVEDAVLDCPGVAEAVAVGVDTPRGPDLGVLVVPEPGVDLRLDTVRGFLDAPLGHRLPRQLCASAPALPRGATGRVDRAAVRRWLETSCSTKEPRPR